MKNFEKFVNVDEREKEFLLFCNGHSDDGSCVRCPLNNKANKRLGCAYAWLDLEANEDPMPCPFCGSECFLKMYSEGYEVYCSEQGCYIGKNFETGDEAIAAHNRVCKAVAAMNCSIKIGDTIAYRTLEGNEPEWKSFTVRLINDGMLYEHEDKSGDNIAIACAHKVIVREIEVK